MRRVVSSYELCDEQRQMLTIPTGTGVHKIDARRRSRTLEPWKHKPLIDARQEGPALVASQVEDSH
jgi:hypothetical protein